MPSPEEIEAAEEFPSLEEDSPSENLTESVKPDFQTETDLSAGSSHLKEKTTGATTVTQQFGSSKKSLLNPTKVVKTADTTLTDRTASPTTKPAIQKELGSVRSEGKEFGAMAKDPVLSQEKSSRLKKPADQSFHTETGLTSAPA
ncbi:MAG: hypothetical protein OXN83_00070, partial [Oligoflexia bacterium]|nr:hypothetical protein [Oligoflexia bacterium]